MDNRDYSVTGAGLGLRRSFMQTIADKSPECVDFYEVAPENWITLGGKMGKQFRELTERFPFICHGLSLSIGSADPLDEVFIREIKDFLQTHQIRQYSEHLSYCSHKGHLYDLLPIPFTSEAVDYVAGRIRRVQDILEQRIAIENVSYYAVPSHELTEIEFFNAVVEQADCDVLLDLNNIYVNSINHGYEAEVFLSAIPGERIAYAHVAGHYVESEDFLVDTHGAAVVDPVWSLLMQAYSLFGIFPTVLERDFNLPTMNELLSEVETIKGMQNDYVSSMLVKRYGR
ncbi:MAG TPA: DUF692 domain-containing protein [Methylococcaceae bacterium]|jgi:uncharacterized protein (UPF0276 family)|nr:DUF692 domain-containing protein [Methylococcaceae bacterium]HIN67895.1 DUF692 domain-containing protein [Methylococcales bacterium]HIA44963.1 DUF692 domain-containing protein [Methylococcaceae bacterium]HIB62687.1 DUF692 domain-containing protein [Methylococcaceae bacterium]HIO13080.1 DUF692 domain-containing protein [Methylococcales bacterium]